MRAVIDRSYSSESIHSQVHRASVQVTSLLHIETGTTATPPRSHNGYWRSVDTADKRDRKDNESKRHMDIRSSREKATVRLCRIAPHKNPCPSRRHPRRR